MTRFSFPIPFGWFYIAAADAVAAAEVKPIRAFGRDLILWRDEGGCLHLQDAYCPHLGANIAVGGEVHGNTVQCPFHKWRFDGNGRNVAIPYATRLNDNANLRTYPLQERYGNVMGWYHPAGAAPSFDLIDAPELDGDEFVGPLSQAHTIRTCLQEMAENTVDSAHFQTIHNHPGEAAYSDIRFDGPMMTMESTQSFPSSRGPVEGTLGAASAGFGWAIVRYRTLVDVCMLTTQVPIEPELSCQVQHVYYRNPERDEKIDRIGQAFVKEVNRQLQQDVPIWENKIYQPSPHLCDGDGPIAKFRRWAQQFYVEGS